VDVDLDLNVVFDAKVDLDLDLGNDVDRRFVLPAKKILSFGLTFKDADAKVSVLAILSKKESFVSRFEEDLFSNLELYGESRSAVSCVSFEFPRS